MITRNATALLAAIFLVTISQAEAKPSKIDNFCGDRYCGYVEIFKIKKFSSKSYVHKSIKSKSPTLKTKKPVQLASLGNQPTSEAPSGNGLLAKAKSYIGTNPTGWRSLWCARFIAYIAPAVADRLKRMGLNPNWARDYAKLPGAKAFGSVGDIVVLTRGRGGHIGILMGFKNGNPIIISGNHGHRVGVGIYSKSRVIAYASI